MATIREPVEGDAAAIGALHVRAWQHAYRGGLMPDEYLDALSADERAQMWREALRRPLRPDFARYVAEDDRGRVVGFVVAGPQDGDEASEAGEIYALNIDPDAWGCGFGRALLESATRDLHAAGFQRLILWVHPGNERARRFYEANGWRDDAAERHEEILGVVTPEVRYAKVGAAAGA